MRIQTNPPRASTVVEAARQEENLRRPIQECLPIPHLDLLDAVLKLEKLETPKTMPEGRAAVAADRPLESQCTSCWTGAGMERSGEHLFFFHSEETAVQISRSPAADSPGCRGAGALRMIPINDVLAQLGTEALAEARVLLIEPAEGWGALLDPAYTFAKQQALQSLVSSLRKLGAVVVGQAGMPAAFQRVQQMTLAKVTRLHTAGCYGGAVTTVYSIPDEEDLSHLSDNSSQVIARLSCTPAILQPVALQVSDMRNQFQSKLYVSTQPLAADRTVEENIQIYLQRIELLNIKARQAAFELSALSKQASECLTHLSDSARRLAEDHFDQLKHSRETQLRLLREEEQKLTARMDSATSLL